MTKIIQITDPHLGPNADFRLAGIQTISSFDAVLAEAASLSPDLLLVTGDIAAHPETSAYRYFFGAIEESGIPMIWLPGNHDVISVVESAENAVPYIKTHDVGNWRLILLDSVLPDTPNGQLGDEELDRFKKLLEETEQDHIMVCLHHHPVPIGCRWLDEQQVSDSDRFLQIVESDNRIRNVVWGHIHQEFEQQRGEVLFTSAPSTCIQFKVGSENFALTEELPGYRIIELSEEGSVTTEVRRTEVPDFQVAIESKGY